MNFLIEEKQFDLDLMKANHFYLSEMAALSININNDYISEEAKPSFVDKLKNTIDKIIKAIKDFLESMHNKITDYIEEKNVRKRLDELEKSNYDKSKKVTLYSSDNKKALLDKYIQEMTKLERELMDIKGVIYASKKDNKRELAMLEYAKISKKLDEINDSFDKKFLDDNKDIIELAAADAIRFSKKSLDSVKVDYEKLEKGSSEILQKFKKDANGCDVPEKANILVKMSNAVATRVRKLEMRMVTYKKSNLVATFAIGAVTGIAVHIAKDKAIGYLKKEGEKMLKDHPEMVQKVKNASKGGSK